MPMDAQAFSFFCFEAHRLLALVPQCATFILWALCLVGLQRTREERFVLFDADLSNRIAVLIIRGTV